MLRALRARRVHPVHMARLLTVRSNPSPPKKLMAADTPCQLHNSLCPEVVAWLLAIRSNPAPPKKLMAADMPSQPPGSLCYDRVFKRILGTKNQSEEILLDLLSAWRMAVTGDSSSAAAEVEIIDVKEGAGFHERGALTVAVRARDAASHFIVEVQRSTETLLPHCALAYAAVGIAGQPPGAPLRPVHVLAFCDFPFWAPRTSSKDGMGLAQSFIPWWPFNAKSEHLRDPTLALHAFDLQPSAAGPHLALQMRAPTLSFLLALLPHAPLLHEITASTPPILKWAGLIAHLRADNIGALPREQGIFTPGVNRLVQVLEQTAETTRKEVRAELEEARKMALHIESELDAAEEDAEEAKGKAKGAVDYLRSIGISSVAQYKDKFGAEPSAELAFFLRSK